MKKYQILSFVLLLALSFGVVKVSAEETSNPFPDNRSKEERAKG